MCARIQHSIQTWRQSEVRGCPLNGKSILLMLVGSVTSTNATAPPKIDYDFSKSQPWVKTAHNLTFLDETPELMNIYEQDDDTGNAIQKTSDWSLPWDERASIRPQSKSSHLHERPAIPPSESAAHHDRVVTSEQSNISTLSSPTKRRRLTFSNSFQNSPTSASSLDLGLTQSPANSWHPSPHTGWTPSAAADNIIDHLTEDIHDSLNFDPALAGHGHRASQTSQTAFTTVSDSLSRIYLESSVWPLSSKEEAGLLRHYVEHLARSFDLSDPLRHFRTVVPQRAATCPTLLNAIFAVSARHLSRVGQYDPLISNRYHQECLKHLIPMLDDSAAILDENLLASTIILRHLEELEVPLSGQSPSDQQSHLLGAHAFITAQERATVSGGLRQAAFWVGLRQEIYVAFVNQRSIMPALEHCNLDRSFEGAADHVWACRMVVLCADVIRYCFGEGDQLSSTYTWLADSVERWHACKPESFTAIYLRLSDEEEVFPEIWFLSDDITMGIQYYHISKILLCAHNPKIPRLGPGRAAALRQMDEDVREHVKVLCGISLSNPDTAPNYT